MTIFLEVLHQDTYHSNRTFTTHACHRSSNQTVKDTIVYLEKLIPIKASIVASRTFKELNIKTTAGLPPDTIHSQASTLLPNTCSITSAKDDFQARTSTQQPGEWRTAAIALGTVAAV